MTIEYSGITYPIREVYWDGCWEIVGTTALESALLPDGANYRDEEAMEIDESILFYLEPKQLFASDDDINEILRLEIGTTIQLPK